jgi:hypothetical protein
MLPPLFDPSPGSPEAKDLIDSLWEALRRSEAKRIVAHSTLGAHIRFCTLRQISDVHRSSGKKMNEPLGGL